ncbi:alpha/beta hydrolase [Chitinophaga pinensis]|uniref:Phospholipase/Carboxylesterase n=1 Tax=Chitinophaga pinensis (strain ATCC 43595 / DSM 2588 / LMG 13176 / NBRC 15968 / NCIMB 11800 / UQM 2034) TaxID=485918 RepID=A0A979GZC6_CHIPD|nr:dienelactone hydrolase family protein [Chitinophaga pinensis]ACU62450.1 phospholipase/Carboxylesterase [Chitinophaga pinensis DSM 2588]
MHTKNIITAGKKTTEAKKALIMIHGRGGSAEDILTLANYLNVKDYALLAPQATGHTWYPYSFLMPPAQNEPWLSSALSVLKEVVDDVVADGIAAENIYFLGFSQGACLTLEFITRNAAKYGGTVAFTGGLIGDQLYPENYSGNFNGSPVFIGTSNPDPHVPVDRVKATEKVLKDMGADITVNVYNNMGHTISQEEINWANQLVFK